MPIGSAVVSTATDATRTTPEDRRHGLAGDMDKRSLTIAGHRTSLALEPEFWAALEEIAVHRGLSLPRLVAEIDRDRPAVNLASAVRLTVLDHFRARATAAVGA
jgi:predicted DNA-binding ribbon-helix-helix protein